MPEIKSIKLKNKKAEVEYVEQPGKKYVLSLDEINSPTDFLDLCRMTFKEKDFVDEADKFNKLNIQSLVGVDLEDA